MSDRFQTLLAACIVAAVAYAGPVTAQNADAVRLDIEDCAGVAGSEVRALVALELAPRAVSASDVRSTAAVRGGITCQRETARIWVDDPARATPLHLDITLRDLAPRARPRLLALALSELIATSRMQRGPQPSAATVHSTSAAQTNPSTRPTQASAREQHAKSQSTARIEPSAGAQTATLTQPSAASVPLAPATTPMASGTTQQANMQPAREVGVTDAAAAWTANPPARQSSSLVWLGAGATRAAAPTLWALAASAGAIQTWDQLAIFADVRFDLARRSKSDLQLGLEGLSLALGPAWHVSSQRFRWLLGPAVRAGYVRLHATASETNLLGRALPGFWLGPCVQTALHVRLSESWAVRFGVELGYVTQTVRGHDANGAPLLALEGAWLSAHAALSWGTARSRP